MVCNMGQIGAIDKISVRSILNVYQGHIITISLYQLIQLINVLLCADGVFEASNHVDWYVRYISQV